MTGSCLAIVQGFAGMRVIDGELEFAPFPLPKSGMVTNSESTSAAVC